MTEVLKHWNRDKKLSYCLLLAVRETTFLGLGLPDFDSNLTLGRTRGGEDATSP